MPLREPSCLSSGQLYSQPCACHGRASAIVALLCKRVDIRCGFTFELDLLQPALASDAISAQAAKIAVEVPKGSCTSKAISEPIAGNMHETHACDCCQLFRELRSSTKAVLRIPQRMLPCSACIAQGLVYSSCKGKS